VRELAPVYLSARVSVRNVKLMSQISDMDDDLRPEYDFAQLPVIARGQGRKRASLTVQLDPGCSGSFSGFWGGE
jgi:hypothetical protein